MKQRFALNTLVVLIVAVCLIASNAMAQTQYLKAGTKALQYQIQNDFLLRSFDGSTISIKKQVSADRAYRLGLTISADIGDREESSSSSTGSVATVKEDNNSQDLQASLQKVFYSGSPGRGHAYVGIGPTARFARLSNERTTISPTGSISVVDQSNHTWSAGLLASLGVEWFAARNISLMAEYNTAATISWQKTKAENTTATAVNTQESDRTNYSLSDNGVRFGLAVYF